MNGRVKSLIRWARRPVFSWLELIIVVVVVSIIQTLSPSAQRWAEFIGLGVIAFGVVAALIRRRHEQAGRAPD